MIERDIVLDAGCSCMVSDLSSCFDKLRMRTRRRLEVFQGRLNEEAAAPDTFVRFAPRQLNHW